jgi:hypothetical protein
MEQLHAAHVECGVSALDVESGDGWQLYHGDCIEVMAQLPSESVGYTVFSPPFASLYTYSSSPRDLGNCSSMDEFCEHFGFVIDELMRLTKPGRLCSFHCMLLPTSKTMHGYIGLQDFRGILIREFVARGWIHHSEVVIWKDPVQSMQRTKALGLLWKQLRKDSCMSRQGVPDYIVTMRKPGDNPERVGHAPEEFPVDEWQKIASPVWMDINPNDTLQHRSARENEDERHICLAAGSLVLTREHGYIEIEDVEPGDHVLTHLGRWRPVTAKKCNGIAETIRVCGQGVADLKVTPSHKLWARMASGSRAKEAARESEPSWSEASTVLGSYLNLKLPPEEPSFLTEEEWWIVGRWLGDGHRGSRRTSGKRGGGLGQFIISCHHNEAPALISRLGKHAGHAARITATQIALVDLRPELREMLSQCGEGARNKRLPGRAATLSVEKSAALLDGYLSADGHYVEKHDRQTASSVSRGLLLGMALVAQRAHGVVASVYAGRPERDGEIQGRLVSMLQDWILSFRRTDGYRKSGWIDELGAWKKVRRIEIAGDAEVWDLQVEEDSSFTAEGAIVHNCPLQLEVVRRCLRLWSNPGDVVLSPFAGIGSEGYCAVQMGRRFVGVELKQSYYRQACANLRNAAPKQISLFGGGAQ